MCDFWRFSEKIDRGNPIENEIFGFFLKKIDRDPIENVCFLVIFEGNR